MSPTVGDVLSVACNEENLFKTTKHFIFQESPTVAIAEPRYEFSYLCDISHFHQHHAPQ